jgi:hypothetical protein
MSDQSGSGQNAFQYTREQIGRSMAGIITTISNLISKGADDEAKAKIIQENFGVIAPMLGNFTAVSSGPTLLSSLVDTLQQLFLPGSKALSTTLLNTMQDSKWINADIRKHIDDMLNETNVKSPLIYIIVPVLMVITYITNLTSASGGLTVQEINSGMRPNLLSGSDVIRAAFIDPSTTGKVREIFAKNGIPEDVIDLAFKSNYALYDISTVQSLFYRGEFSGDDVYKRLREMGYTDARILEITKTWDLIPPVQDIITMAVREAFSPEQVTSLGLDERFPSDFGKWAKKQGYSEEWAKMYWRSHWRLPSAEMGFEMFHRGKITDAELEGLIVALDFSPVWIERLKAISYNVPTRVDVRRMFELGLMDRNGLLRSHLDMGYNPETAEMLTKWVEIEYNAETRKLTETQIIQEYLNGFIEETEMRRLLTLLAYSADRIDMMVATASYKRASARQGERISALKKLFLSGQYGKEEVTAELDQFNIDPRWRDELIDLWGLEYKAGLKLPRYQDIVDWFSRDVIDQQTFVIEMHRLGYNDHYITMFADSVSRDVQDALDADAERAAQKAEKAGNAAAAADLRKANAEAKATTAANAKREILPAVPSKGDLASWYVQGVIDEGTFRQRMAELRFTSTDIELYVAELKAQHAGLVK